MKQMRLLLDQMLDASVAAALHDLRYDVVRVADIGMARADDAEILEHAIAEGRVLVTLDEHFGDWVVLPLSLQPGVTRVKADPANTSEILGILIPFLDDHGGRDFRNRLVIVRRAGVRWIDTATEA